jgi:hypothetical protein
MTASLSPCFGGPLAEGFLRAVISSECNSNLVVEKTEGRSSNTWARAVS